MGGLYTSDRPALASGFSMQQHPSPESQSGMQAYDIVMLVVLGATAFLGFRRGLAWQVASVGAIVASYVVAIRFRDVVAPHLRATPPWNTFLAMLILYVATSFSIWVLFQLVRGMIDRLKLKEFDQQLGLIFGLAKGVLLCVVITFFAVTLLGPDLRRQIIESHSGLYIARLLNEADSIMPAELHEYLDPYMDKLGQHLQGSETQGGEPEEQGELEEMQRWLKKEADQLLGESSDQQGASSDSGQPPESQTLPVGESASEQGSDGGLEEPGTESGTGGSYYRRMPGTTPDSSKETAPESRGRWPRLFPRRGGA